MIHCVLHICINVGFVFLKLFVDSLSLLDTKCPKKLPQSCKNISEKFESIFLVVSFVKIISTILTLLAFFWGGDGWAKFSEKCQCSYNNITASIKQITLFDTALVMTNTLSFSSK